MIRAVLAALLACGCSRALELFPTRALPSDWGTYADDPSIPGCPDAPELLVNTVADELDGGPTISDPAQAGPALSLVEAMWIASNRPGPDTIRFDPTVFPTAAPATIRLSGDNAFPDNPTEPFCLDGRGRGVVVDWDPNADFRPLSIWRLGRGSLMVGLTLLHMPYELAVVAAQVAGCRIGTDGTIGFAGARPWALDALGGAQIGPLNALGGQVSVRASLAQPPDAHVFGNDIGRDPLTGALLGGDSGMQLCQPALIEDNVFATPRAFWLTLESPGDGALVVRKNRFGVDRAGTPIGSGGRIDSGNLFADPAIVFSENILRDVTVVVPASRFQMTRNSFYGAGSLAFSGPAVVDPPTIVTATPTSATLRCGVAGTVEIFSDRAALGETFLADASCAAGETISVSIPTTHARNLTATLTDAAQRTSTFSTPVAVP